MTEVILVNNTRIPLDEIEDILDGHPLDAKKRAAFEVVKIFHGKEAAQEAQKKFEVLVQGQSFDEEDLPEVKVSDSSLSIMDIVRECLDSDTSNSQIRRLINQGAVKVDGTKLESPEKEVDVPSEGVTVRVGKKRWFRVVKA
jgi:tyrosyl-tRNA synthetase